MKASLKWAMMLLIAVALAACSSKSDDKNTTSVVGGDQATGAGVGSNQDFDDSMDARMAKILGIEKNTIYFDFDKDVIKAAATANAARIRSGQRFLPMLHTACATTATATILSPCIQPALTALLISDKP